MCSHYSSSLVFSHVVPGNRLPRSSSSINRRLRRSSFTFNNLSFFSNVFRNSLPVKCQEFGEDGIEEEAIEERISNEIKEGVHKIKSMLGSMEDGEISISAYDTAWVALVQGSGAPQFPSALQWIANNQLLDGSWGDLHLFSAYDRLINTLACVVALKSWNIHPDICEKGLVYLKENISKLENENDEHMPVGFEVAFPSLLELARSLEIDIPYDSPVLQKIYAKRNLKLARIPKDIMHNVPTTLLHSLEGMADLNWEKLLKLQCQDGSFLFSPASTAYALMQTKDENCFKYLTKVVQRFNGGVPGTYPVDLFEHIWAVDRLQRLGISRYFRPEIKECMNYIYRYWTEEGICWARNARVQDLDDTAMGFRLLRLYGFDVSADVFGHFLKDGEFFCFVGQSTQAVSGLYNLYRASELVFSGEKILEHAKQFSGKFLRGKKADELLDKWVIAKDLPGEVAFALEVPWYANLPRLETRYYIEQYGGQDDVWIGKTLYRMHYVNNNVYLNLAKLDYNNCQAVHQTEWDSLQKWYQEYKLVNFGTTGEDLLLAYFVASASIYEPARWPERIAWAKTIVLVKTIISSFDEQKDSIKQRRAFVNEFTNCINSWDIDGRKGQGFTGRTLLGTVNHMALDAQGRDIGHQLREAWEKWLMKWQDEGDRHQGVAELLMQTIYLSAGCCLSEELLCHSEYVRLSNLTNKICHALGHYQMRMEQSNGSYNGDNIITTLSVESDMQELVQLVLQLNSSSGIDSNVKKTFLSVAKSFYYSAYFDPETINSHIDKVLFQRVD